MSLNYQLTTRPSFDGRIEQELYFIEDKAAERVAYWVVYTRDAQVKAALIQLGWTPPKTEKS